MRGVLALTRRAVTGRVAVFALLTLFVAAGLGTALTSLTAAWHTDHAYPAYLRQAEATSWS